jgi:hypothetical protein
MEKKNYKLLVILIGATLFFSMIGTCTSCKNNKDLKMQVETLKLDIDENFYTKEELLLRMEIRGLEDERRSVLNINQIFLTRKRPDQRVIEIDKEIEQKEIKLNTLIKKRLKDAEEQRKALETQ